MKASEVMKTDAVTIRGSATVAQAVKLMREKGTQGLVIERRHDEDAFGILTENDVIYQVTAFGKDPNKVRVSEIMNKPCIAVRPDLGIEYVARLFAQTNTHFAPVLQDGLLGTISTSDILHKGNFVERPRSVTLAEAIDKARVNARAICSEKGAISPECAAAWDIVEELQAEAAHQRAESLEKTHFDEYIEENPDAFAHKS